MLDVIFNDSTSYLSLVAINGDEGFKVLDIHCTIYAEMQNVGFDITRDDLIRLWLDATDNYFSDTIKEPAHKKYLEKMKKLSLDSFKKFLNEQFKEGDDGE
jgi:hypothetical protein